MRIKIDSTKKVTLYNHEFDEMRNALDVTLQTTLKSMIAKNMTGASIGLKIDITLMKQVLKDDNAPTGTREALRPDINARIVAAMQQRVDKKVGVIGKTSNVELLVDDTGDFFFVTKEEASGQLSMFNSWDEFKDAAEENQDAADAEDTDEPQDTEDAGEDDDAEDEAEDAGEETEETEDEDDADM